MRHHRITAACHDTIGAPLERHVLRPRRTSLLAELTGLVLDIGAATGANLPHLPTAAKVIAVEPDAAMRRRLARKAADAPMPVEIFNATAQSLPFPDHRFDAALFTLMPCTLADPTRALAEAHRTHKPGGTLIVLEHVHGTGRLAHWQDRITPIWCRIAAGCHPNRDTQSTIQNTRFHWTSIQEFQPIPAWTPVSPMLQGIAINDKAR